MADRAAPPGQECALRGAPGGAAWSTPHLRTGLVLTREAANIASISLIVLSKASPDYDSPTDPGRRPALRGIAPGVGHSRHASQPQDVVGGHSRLFGDGPRTVAPHHAVPWLRNERGGGWVSRAARQGRCGTAIPVSVTRTHHGTTVDLRSSGQRRLA